MLNSSSLELNTAACDFEGKENEKKSNCTFPVRTEGNSVSNLLLSPNLKKRKTCEIKPKLD